MASFEVLRSVWPRTRNHAANPKWKNPYCFAMLPPGHACSVKGCAQASQAQEARAFGNTPSVQPQWFFTRALILHYHAFQSSHVCEGLQLHFSRLFEFHMLVLTSSFLQCQDRFALGNSKEVCATTAELQEHMVFQFKCPCFKMKEW